MSKKVGIILINYKDYAQRYLSACRDSLRAQDYEAELTQVYIIDNAATPESNDFLKNNYPEAIILPRPDGNYAAAGNLGFKQALADGVDYVVSVNMDTETDSRWLGELVKGLDNNPAAGLAQAKILLYPKNEAEKISPKINSLGNSFHFLGFGFASGYDEPDREISGYPEIKGYASGCSFIIRRVALEKIGGYNEEYYMYHDDIELSLKAKLAGYKIILAPQALIYHKYEFSRSVKMIYYMERNRYLTIFTFYPVYLLILVALPGVIMDLGMLVYSMFGGWFKTEMKIYGYFFRLSTYAKIHQERKKISQLRKVPLRLLARGFVGKIEFQEIANPLLKYLVNPLFNFYWRIARRLI